MRKQLFNVLLSCLLVVPFMSTTADTIDEGQSTEGKDFWVTFMQADQGGDQFSLDLAISSRYACTVKIENPFTGKDTTITVSPNVTTNFNLDTITSKVAQARTNQLKSGLVCYVKESEEVDTCALHITSDNDISLFASNYQYASFDATNVLPTPSLQDEYIIQTYSPSDNAGDGSSQGSHFAIVATEDSTVVEYTLTANTNGNKHKKGDVVTTDTLKKGQVWYVWTGKGKVKAAGDLSGTHIKAYNAYTKEPKRIAVFQGCPHTNIPYKVKLRDHIFSQAMPVSTWGNTFVLTASNGRKRDIYRVMALNDGTTIYIGDSAYKTINAREYWEFELGEAYETLAAPTVQGQSCVLRTSCPCAVHQFMVSQQYDGDSKNNGDPAMLWINPIEQQINQITFSTYSSKKGTTAHNINIVTADTTGIKLDNVSISSEFQRVNGSTTYWFARHSLGSETRSYTLKSESGNFIAHVYGFTKNESYAYSAGGYVKPISQSIYINGEEFSPDKENKLCGKDTVHFACQLDFTPDSIVWHFGDGTPDVTLLSGNASKDIPHFYELGGIYDASCTIYRNSSNVCVGQSAQTVINIQVNIGRYEFSIGQAEIPCPEADGTQKPGTIPYTSTIDLKGGNVKVDFDAVAKAAGFGKDLLTIKPDHFELEIPIDAVPGVTYGIMIEVKNDCGDTLVTLPFRLPVGNDVIDQRYSNVLGLLKDHPQIKGLALSDFQWYYNSDSTAVPGANSPVLNIKDVAGDSYMNDEFYLCYWINKGQPDSLYNCACAKSFVVDSTKYSFSANPDSLIITASYNYQHGDKVFVNANWGGKTEIECYAQWITTSGNIYKDWKFLLPDGGCLIDTPTEPDLYLLRVVTDKQTRSFKFIIQ